MIHVETGEGVMRPVLREELGEKYFSYQADKDLNPSSDLVLRLWLTMNINAGVVTSIGKSAAWNEESNLADFIATYFPPPGFEMIENIAIGSDLTAVNLEKTCGIRISPTSTLEDHLLFDRQHRTLKVYSLGDILQHQSMR